MKELDHSRVITTRRVRPLGYVESGRFAADAKMQEAREHLRRFARARRWDDTFWQRHHWMLAILSYRSAKNLQQAVREFDV